MAGRLLRRFLAIFNIIAEKSPSTLGRVWRGRGFRGGELNSQGAVAEGFLQRL